MIHLSCDKSLVTIRNVTNALAPVTLKGWQKKKGLLELSHLVKNSITSKLKSSLKSCKLTMRSSVLPVCFTRELQFAPSFYKEISPFIRNLQGFIYKVLWFHIFGSMILFPSQSSNLTPEW